MSSAPETWYAPFESSIVNGFVAATRKGLCAVELGTATEGEFLGGLAARFGVGPVRDAAKLESVLEGLQRYFAGQRPKLGFALDFGPATEFQKAVWRAVSRIPYGQVRTYAQIAAEVGKPRASRAVGQAVGANPIPIIVPCHRVVASGGGLGGFSAGLALKKKLLRLEEATGVRWYGKRNDECLMTKEARSPSVE